MTLTEFLLARIAEDIAEIGPASDCDCDVIGLPLRHGVRCPVRMLAECEAKRQIVEHAEQVSAMDQQIEGEWGTRGSVPEDEDEGIRLLRFLAVPYADDPDYDPAWRL